jgi:hydroxyacylglutathione hydrolase
VDPANATIAAKLDWAQAKQAAREPTVPSSVGAEKRHNVFLLCGCAAVRAACGLLADAPIIDCLGALRALKDSGK